MGNEQSKVDVENKRCKRVTVRFTEDEYKTLERNWKRTTCRKLSDYVRKILFNRQVTVRQRNQSMDDFMGVLILLRTDLNALGNNFNQVVKRLNTPQLAGKYSKWLPIAESLQKELLSKVDNIQVRINEFAKQWLQ